MEQACKYVAGQVNVYLAGRLALLEVLVAVGVVNGLVGAGGSKGPASRGTVDDVVGAGNVVEVAHLVLGMVSIRPSFKRQ